MPVESFLSYPDGHLFTDTWIAFGQMMPIPADMVNAWSFVAQDSGGVFVDQPCIRYRTSEYPFLKSAAPTYGVRVGFSSLTNNGEADREMAFWFKVPADYATIADSLVNAVFDIWSLTFYGGTSLRIARLYYSVIAGVGSLNIEVSDESGVLHTYNVAVPSDIIDGDWHLANVTYDSGIGLAGTIGCTIDVLLGGVHALDVATPAIPSTMNLLWTSLAQQNVADTYMPDVLIGHIWMNGQRDRTQYEYAFGSGLPEWDETWPIGPVEDMVFGLGSGRVALENEIERFICDNRSTGTFFLDLLENYQSNPSVMDEVFARLESEDLIGETLREFGVFTSDLPDTHWLACDGDGWATGSASGLFAYDNVTITLKIRTLLDPTAWGADFCIFDTDAVGTRITLAYQNAGTLLHVRIGATTHFIIPASLVEALWESGNFNTFKIAVSTTNHEFWLNNFPLTNRIVTPIEPIVSPTTLFIGTDNTTVTLYAFDIEYLDIITTRSDGVVIPLGVWDFDGDYTSEIRSVNDLTAGGIHNAFGSAAGTPGELVFFDIFPPILKTDQFRHFRKVRFNNITPLYPIGTGWNYPDDFEDYDHTDELEDQSDWQTGTNKTTVVSIGSTTPLSTYAVNNWERDPNYQCIRINGASAGPANAPYWKIASGTAITQRPCHTLAFGMDFIFPTDWVMGTVPIAPNNFLRGLCIALEHSDAAPNPTAYGVFIDPSIGVKIQFGDVTTHILPAPSLGQWHRLYVELSIPDQTGTFWMDEIKFFTDLPVLGYDTVTSVSAAIQAPDRLRLKMFDNVGSVQATWRAWVDNVTITGW